MYVHHNLMYVYHPPNNGKHADVSSKQANKTKQQKGIPSKTKTNKHRNTYMPHILKQYKEKGKKKGKLQMSPFDCPEALGEEVVNVMRFPARGSSSSGCRGHGT